MGKFEGTTGKVDTISFVVKRDEAGRIDRTNRLSDIAVK